MLAELAADPGLLVPAKRRDRVNIVVTIDPHGAGPQGTRDFVSACQEKSPLES